MSLRPSYSADPAHDPSRSLQSWVTASRRLFAMAAVALILIVIALAIVWNREVGGYAKSPISPILLVTPIQSEADSASKALGQTINGKLLDGLSHIWTARIGTNPAASATNGTNGAYRLETEVGPSISGRRSLFVRLLDKRTSTLVWSREYDASEQRQQANRLTDMVLADIGGSYGVIAQNETRRLNDNFAPGYACLLQYFRYLTTRNPQVRGKIADCLATPAPETHLEGTRQGVHAMFALDVPSSDQTRARQIRLANAQAQLAVEQHPRDYFAQFALARLSLAQGDCDIGARHTRLTMANNPNDPLVVGVLSALTHFCGAPDTLGLADRVFKFQENGDTSARLTTILVAIATDRRDRLEALANMPIPQSGENQAFVHLCNTLLFAALDNIPAARGSWNSYRAILGSERSAPDLLAQFLVADVTREGVEQFLRKKRVI